MPRQQVHITFNETRTQTNISRLVSRWSGDWEFIYSCQALQLQQHCASDSEITVYHGTFKAFEESFPGDAFVITVSLLKRRHDVSFYSLDSKKGILKIKKSAHPQQLRWYTPAPPPSWHKVHHIIPQSALSCFIFILSVEMVPRFGERDFPRLSQKHCSTLNIQVMVQ